MNRILLIEDDVNIQKLIRLELNHANYIVDSAYDGEQAVKFFSQNKYDIILLDLMLPKKFGKELCKEFRLSSNTTILIITAKDSIPDKVELLDLGANDYICKPFAMEELLARIRSNLRNQERNKKEHEQFIFCGDLKLDISSKQIFLKNENMILTKTEFLILKYFMKHIGQSCSRGQLIENVWGYDFDGEEKIVDVYINSLRKK